MRRLREIVTAFTFIMTFAVAIAEEDDHFKATVEVKKLLEESDAAIRPSVNNEPTTVKVQTFIRHIAIDQENEKITVDVILRLKWNDYRLVYNTEGVDYVTILNPKLAWLPDPFFPNGFATHHKSVHRESFIRVHPNGNVTFSTRLSVTLYCPVDVTRLNDTQSCVMNIASYAYTARELVFEWENENPAVFGKHLRAGSFSLEKSETQGCHSKTDTGDYSCVKLELFLRRDMCS